jgi:hypothetical protein
MPRSSLVKFGVTDGFSRPSTEAATGAASLEKAVAYQWLQSCTGCGRPRNPTWTFAFSLRREPCQELTVTAVCGGVQEEPVVVDQLTCLPLCLPFIAIFPSHLC